MNNDVQGQADDPWSHWLLHSRHGGDARVAESIRLQVAGYVERVLDGARISPDMTLLDVGTGDGAVALRAIARLGPGVTVIATDISAPMLAYVAAFAAANGVGGQFSFVECSADNLAGVDDASVDAAMTRAVLAYVGDKASALRAFYRVLKPGGWMSICEPIMRDEALVVCALKGLIEMQPPESRDRLLGLQYRIRAAQFPDTIEKIADHPCTNFTERDLVRLAQAAGFTDVHMEFHIDVHLESITSWAAFLASSPHPLARTVKQIIADDFTDEERAFFVEQYRPIIEAGHAGGTSRNAFLTARKP